MEPTLTNVLFCRITPAQGWISGHTRRGTRSEQNLSCHRRGRHAKYLVEKGCQDPERIEAFGFGTQPIRPRRVEDMDEPEGRSFKPMKGEGGGERRIMDWRIDFFCHISICPRPRGNN